MALPPGTAPLAALAAGAAVAAYLGVAYWLYRDAAARGSERPLAWAVSWALFTAAALAYYLAVRGRIGERTAHPSTWEALAGTVGLGVALAFAVAAALGPPDPVSQVRLFAPALAVALPAAYGLRLVAGRARRGRGARRE